MRIPTGVVLALALFLSVAAPAAAQTAPVGVRAAGMGGAFTAVADDGTAPYWNPAGLASGAFVGLAIDVNDFDRQPNQYLGLATPPLGFSYFRRELAGSVDGGASTSTASTGNSRNGAVETFVAHQAGVTLVQSVGDTGLAVGATVGGVHGNGATSFSADAGVMFAREAGSVGLSVHNLTEPSLGGVRLDRRVRLGAALRPGRTVTVAGDIDLTTVTAPQGPWRDVALGVETHPHARAWLRSGVHWNSTGSAALPIGSVGGSFAVYGLLRVDAQASFGAKGGDRGWGAGMSIVY